ncbi:MAG: DUF456 family protein [Chroococcidiopsidaceae cyanobacterium CP_BM_ER_R8_30]|nr:DUF456 family protein [Chroococcidiopsidaceae cyanobacterium CP_BM_ER_R8_30]
MDTTVLYWILVAVMVAGVIGSIFPGFPGTILVLAAIVIWGATQGFSDVYLPLGLTIVVLLLNLGIDFLASFWGAKQFGASKWGQVGALVGLLLGVLGFLPALTFGGPLLGIIVGPLVGAITGEFIYRRELELAERAKLSLRAGVGIVVGSLVGKLIQVLLALVAVAVFIFTTWDAAGIHLTLGYVGLVSALEMIFKNS